LPKTAVYFSEAAEICCSSGQALAKRIVQDGVDRRGFLELTPICAWCKKIRDVEGRWRHLDRHISLHSDAQFTHGLCEECAAHMKAEAFSIASMMRTFPGPENRSLKPNAGD
jgi:hypothetical protein